MKPKSKNLLPITLVVLSSIGLFLIFGRLRSYTYAVPSSDNFIGDYYIELTGAILILPMLIYWFTRQSYKSAI